MATAAAPRKAHTYLDYVPTYTDPGIPLVDSDGIPMESNFHVWEIYLLLDILATRYPDRDDYFASGNIFLYFNEEQARNRDYKGPDFFFVKGKGVDRHRKRSYWAIWKEGGRLPNTIIEMLSPTTMDEDLTTKKDLYEKVLKTPEYFVYDFDTAMLQGWRLNRKQVYKPIKPNEHGWLWSEEMDMWLGTWEGDFMGQTTKWLRGYDEQGRLYPVGGERSGEEKRRAESAEAEVARLRALLANKEKRNGK